MKSGNELKKNETFDLKAKKEKVKTLLNQYKTSEIKDEKILDEIMSLDDTLPDIYLYKLKNSDDIKLKEKSLDLVDKNSLKELNIDKKLNYKEIYFKIIEYIVSIILDEPEKAYEDFDIEEFLNEGENATENFKINEEELKEYENNKQNNQIYNINKIINFDITSLLIIGEKINVNNIKIKFSQIYEAYFSIINFKNNYPDFESELFYFNCLRYMLDTYKKLKYKRFIKKMSLTRYMQPLTNKIKNNDFDDDLKKILYYYIMNTQYNFDSTFLNLLIYEDFENKTLLPEYNNEFSLKNNKLYYKNEIVLDNADNYLINKMIKSEIIFKENYDFFNFYYSIKGIINNSLFTKEDGDKYWEEFLSSKVLDDIVQNLYKKENIFNQRTIKDLFKGHSYYFPNYNKSFKVLNHKELFMMYFPPSQMENLNFEYKYTYTINIINKVVNKIKIINEWENISSSPLFFNLKNKECEKNVEFLMFGRIIEDLNIKEAIFILNSNNYNLSLNEFRSVFMNLKNKKLEDIFKAELNNSNIDDNVIKVYEEYKEKGEKFQLALENYSFNIKRNKNGFINLDKIRFKIGKNDHNKIKPFKKYKKK